MDPLFELSNVSFAYETQQVIDDISLLLEPGHFYGIIGPNGCGKSTCIDLLIGHQRSEKGKITYRDTDIGAYSKKELSREMALVPQNFYINFPFTALEVVMMGRYPHIPRFAAPGPEDIDIIQQVMTQTDTLKFENRLITELSGGERQRVIFARALAQDTPVLVLDEATSNLDVNHTLALLNQAARGVDTGNKTVIAVLQDINLAAVFCDYLIFMQAGKVAVHGPTADTLTRETLHRIFGVESKVYFESYANALQVVFKR
jgi:cobalamin transport system ATP-binding protein